MVLLRLLWQLYDGLYVRLTGLRRVGQGERELLAVRVIRYKGPPLTLPDGTTVSRGNDVGELHFLSSNLRSLHGNGRQEAAVGMAILNGTMASLEALALYVATNSSFRSVPAFYAHTLFHRGVNRLGFRIDEIPPSPHRTFLRYYLRWLLAVYHPEGLRRLRRHTSALEPKAIWISREELLRRYLSPKVRPMHRRLS